MTNQLPREISVNRIPNRDFINSLELMMATGGDWHGRLNFIEAGPVLEKIKRLEAENEELKEVISELSKSMSAIADLSSHMKLASTLFTLKGDSK